MHCWAWLLSVALIWKELLIAQGSKKRCHHPPIDCILQDYLNQHILHHFQTSKAINSHWHSWWRSHSQLLHITLHDWYLNEKQRSWYWESDLVLKASYFLLGTIKYWLSSSLKAWTIKHLPQYTFSTVQRSELFHLLYMVTQDWFGAFIISRLAWTVLCISWTFLSWISWVCDVYLFYYGMQLIFG